MWRRSELTMTGAVLVLLYLQGLVNSAPALHQRALRDVENVNPDDSSMASVLLDGGGKMTTGGGGTMGPAGQPGPGVVSNESQGSEASDNTGEVEKSTAGVPYTSIGSEMATITPQEEATADSGDDPESAEDEDSNRTQPGGGGGFNSAEDETGNNAGSGTTAEASTQSDASEPVSESILVTPREGNSMVPPNASDSSSVTLPGPATSEAGAEDNGREANTSIGTVETSTAGTHVDPTNSGNDGQAAKVVTSSEDSEGTTASAGGLGMGSVSGTPTGGEATEDGSLETNDHPMDSSIDGHTDNVVTSSDSEGTTAGTGGPGMGSASGTGREVTEDSSQQEHDDEEQAHTNDDNGSNADTDPSSEGNDTQDDLNDILTSSDSSHSSSSSHGSGNRVAMGFGLLILVGLILVGTFFVYRRYRAKGRGYITLGEFGNYEGMQNPNYDGEL